MLDVHLGVVCHGLGYLTQAFADKVRDVTPNLVFIFNWCIAGACTGSKNGGFQKISTAILQ